MSILPRNLAAALLAGASLLVLPAVASAASAAIGLVGDKTLVMIDTETGAISGTMEVSGVDKLWGIDVRPGDGKLYGVAGDGTIVTIDTATGAATAGAKLTELLPDGVDGMVDFNPMADKLRVMGSDGTNLRVDPDTGETTVDGKLAFEAGDANAEKTPEIVATAYINSFGKPEKTAMYDIASDGTFIQQVKPNDGTLKTIGALGVTSDTYAFDVQTTEDGTNTAWLAAAGALYTVNLETGAAEKKADISGGESALRDIAVLPAM